MMPRRAAVIMNPCAGYGRMGRQWPSIEAELRTHFEDLAVFPTEASRHATTLTRRALKEGYSRIISAGGDGTHHEVLNGFFEEGQSLNPDAVLALFPCGTGSDLARTLRIPRGRRALEAVCGDSIVSADVGRVQLLDHDGNPETIYFLNTCHVGMGGEVAVQVKHSLKRFGGFAAFLWGTLRALCRYTDKNMRIECDGRVLEQPVKDLIVAKGQYDGGGMHIAPFARLDSGTFEVYLIGKVSFVDTLLSLPRLYRGSLHERTDIVQYFRASTIQVECDEPVYVSPDGELPGTLPARFDLLPRAVRLAHAGYEPGPVPDVSGGH